MNEKIEVGLDIIEIKRIKKSIKKLGNKFIDKTFSNNEKKYCLSKVKSSQHFAGRFAVKEAVMKLFGTGWAEGIKWTDIEVVNNEKGKPILNLYNKALEIKNTNNFSEISISISHSEKYATAVAVCLIKDLIK